MRRLCLLLLLPGCLVISDAQLKERLSSGAPDDTGAPKDSGDTDTDTAADRDTDTGIPSCDEDGDGHLSTAAGCDGDDCDDHNAAVHPGATETCDGLDSDCDGADGTTAALDFADPADDVLLDSGPGTLTLGEAWTVEAWIMPDTATESGTVLSKVDSSLAEQKVFGLSFGAPYAIVIGTDLSATYAAATATLPSGVWSHVAWQGDDGEVSILVDGVAQVTIPSTSEPYDDDAGTATIGAFPGDDEAYTTTSMTGLLSDLRISDVARYSSPADPAATLDLDSDTEAFWPLDEGTGDTIYDLSAGAVNGTLAGPVWESTPCRD